MVISLANIQLRAPIGCSDAERRVGNRFAVDVELTVRCDEAAAADDLDGTVNYARVYDIVRAEMGVPCRIVENAVWRISRKIEQEWGVEKIEKIVVRVSKMYPPVGGKVEKATVELVNPEC